MAGILLIEPPRVDPGGNLRIYGSIGSYKTNMCWQPLDLMIISGYLEKNNIESEILDANALNLSFDDLKRDIEAKKPDLIVFTTSTSTIDSDMKVKTIADGMSIKAVPIGSHVNNPEPEKDILKIAKGEKPTGEKIKNLDELGFPSHDKINKKLYSDPFQKREPFTITYASRGCGYSQCIYCSCPAFFKPMRLRSVGIVIDELKWIQELGFKEIKWFDADFNNNIEHTRNIVKGMIKENIDLTWSGVARVDNITLEDLKLWRDAGCHSVHIGVESSSTKILQNAKKNITVEQVRNAVKNIHKAGMDAVTYCMFGLPYETKETMKNTLEFIKELGPDATTFSIATPHPNTEFYMWLEKNGYLYTKDFSKYNPSLKPVYNYPNLSADEIYDFMKFAQKDFYLRPKFLFKHLVKIRGFKDLKNGVKAIKYIRGRY
jgi:anaerobic magnesium-protoporphyrin IX monomethyl ester cyclase